MDVCFRRVHTYRDESLSAPPTSPDSIREQTDVTGSGRLVSRCLIDHEVPSCQRKCRDWTFENLLLAGRLCQFYFASDEDGVFLVFTGGDRMLCLVRAWTKRNLF